MKTYLFSYNYEGSEYALEIQAENIEEAKGRIAKITFAKYDGILESKVPANPLSGFIVRIYVWIRNAFK